VRERELEVEFQPWVCETLADAASGHAVDAGFPTREQSALISPTGPACVAQDHLEPVLERHLRSLGPARIERGLEVTAVESRDDGATLTVRDRDGGRERQVRASYLVAADGIRSTVRTALEFPTSRREHLGERQAVQFRAPLWDLVGELRYAIYFITGTPEPSALVPAGPPDRWVFATDWGEDGDPLSDIRRATGYPSLDVVIDNVATVSYGVDLAARFRQQNVFLVGDAAHRVTPRGATGLNTAIRDGYDLGWKLAWVLRGWAAEDLLDTYEAERRPVAEHNTERSADANGSVRGVSDELRADLGGRIAHLWVNGETERVSTLDLIGNGLTLFTGPRGSEWNTAAASIPATVPLAVRGIDELTARALGIAGPGALLVRPDGVPAGIWRNGARDAGGLRGAVESVTLSA
jgi:2-polyprenyl-6-methoxyphenol hydroxylase-like FAD-dependent oxidoreductase